MSSNREVTKATLALFEASESGDAKAVAELVKTADLNWHCTQSVLVPNSLVHSCHLLCKLHVVLTLTMDGNE